MAGAILFLVMLFFLGLSLSFPEQYSSNMLSKKMKNIEKEYAYAVSIASNRTGAVELQEMSQYMSDEISGFNVFYVCMKETDKGYDVFIGNFFNSKVNVNVESDSADIAELSLVKGKISVLKLDNTVRKISINYTIDSSTTFKTFLLEKEVISYFDIMISDRDMLRDQFIV